MKRLNNIIVAILLVSGLASCKKFLETIPKDSTTDANFYNTEGQLKSALAGVYHVMTLSGTYGSGLPGLMNVDADESFYNRSTQIVGMQMNNVTTSDSRLNANWAAWYSGIHRANMLLANINKPAMSDAARGAIRGEALFLRAYYYFMLVSYYGNVPLILEPINGVNDVNRPQAPAREVYEQVIKDMTEAEALVNDIQDNGNAEQVSKSAVRGILARVCLYMAGEPLKDASKYELARFWAKKVMDDPFHGLNNEYKQVFINMSSDSYDLKESIWEVGFYGNPSGTYKASGYIGISNGQTHNGTDPEYGFRNGYVAPTPKLYFSYGSGDFRRDWNISNYTLSNTNPAVRTYQPSKPDLTQASERNCAKWRREYETVLPRDASGSPINFPLLRYSDILLMFAEADASITKDVPSEDAVEAVNKVRRRAYGKFHPEKELVDTIVIANAGSGYLSPPAITINGGGGSGATAVATVITRSSRYMTGIYLTNQGSGYTSIPTVTVGTAWTANTVYANGQQITNAGKVYTVTTAGTSTSTPPTQSSGASSAGATGAVFTYAGINAVATARIINLANVDADLKDEDIVDYSSFMKVLKAERSRELAFECLRKMDLVRWGDYLSAMQQLALDFSQQTARQWGGRAAQNTTVRDLLWPIPDGETTVNSAIVQNKGW